MRKFYAHWTEINPVEVIRETKARIFLANEYYPRGEQPREKISTDCGYFDTFEKARSFLIGIEEEKIANITRELGRRQETVEKIKALKEAPP